MSEVIEEALLLQISELLRKRMGLDFPRKRWPSMLHGLGKACEELGFTEVATCVKSLVSSALGRQQVEVLASHLSVGETYFFRDPALFQALECDILPQLIAQRRAAGQLRLRFWSAGCCTGEEPYSLAILVHRLIPDLGRWDIKILGTDINPRFLARAAEGLYRDWSFRGVPDWLRRQYFDAVPGGYRLAEHCRALVSFEYLNLADDLYPSAASHTDAMDLVLCRNVLMYFDAETIDAVQRKIGLALVPGGWVSVAASEAGLAPFRELEPVQHGGAFFFRKNEDDPPRTGTPSPLASAEGAREKPPFALRPPAVPVPAAAPPVPGERSASDMALLAHRCADAGDLDGARARCEAAIEMDRLNAGLRYLLGTILEESGQEGEAVSALRQALYLDQGHVLAHIALGNHYRRQCDVPRAEKHLSFARRLLRSLPADAVLPDSGGLAAAGMLDLIESTERLR